MKTLLFLLSFTFLVQGCATGYQKSGMAGGYTETRLGENIFMVNFRGNGFTSSEKASDFALLRSAELALENGYSYFEIVDANSHTSSSSYTTPTTSTTTANVYGYGNYAYGTARTTTYGGQTYNVSKPSSSRTIVCYKEKPDEFFTFSAEFIYKELSTKYRLTNR
jgi:uncharacterized protein (UPF0333 family)